MILTLGFGTLGIGGFETATVSQITLPSAITMYAFGTVSGCTSGSANRTLAIASDGLLGGTTLSTATRGYLGTSLYPCSEFWREIVYFDAHIDKVKSFSLEL